MAYYVTSSETLTDLADAIREKGGTTGPLEFPDEFISAIDDISTELPTQTKSATPTESAQTITPDTGYTLSSVSVGAIDSNYVGSGITRRSSTNLTVNGATVTAPAGYYSASASKAVASGSATTPATTVTANPSISVSNTGLITATASGSKSVTPTVSAGYVSSGTAGTVTVSGSNTSQLSTQEATTYHPSTTDQTIASGKYLTGAQTIKAVTTTNLTAENILAGVTVKIGDSTDDDCVASVIGTASGGGGVVVVETPDEHGGTIVEITGEEIKLQAKTNISPTTSSQTIEPDNGYTGLSSVQINAMPNGTAGTPVATKGTVSNHSISVTPSVTNTTGYITGSTKTGTAVTVSASELVSGSETKTANGTYDVTNLAELVVNVSGGESWHIGTATMTNSSAAATSISFTGLSGSPKAFWVRCTTTLTRSSSYKEYYCATMRYNGTNTYGNRWYRYNGQFTNITSGYSYTYSDGTLTLSSSGTQSTSPGSFYNGTYELTYIY